MTLYTFSSGINTSFSTQLNANINECLVLNGLNTIRQLQDRTVTFSNGQNDGWGEAYIDGNGRLDSVNVDDRSKTTAYYDSVSLKYITAPTAITSDTTHDPDGFTNPSYAFDTDGTTGATKSYSNSGGDTSYYLGKTFSAKTVTYIYTKVYLSQTQTGNGTNYMGVYLETYNGATWDAHSTLSYYDAPDGGATLAYEGATLINASVQGVRIRTQTRGNDATTDATHTIYTIQYGTTPGDSLITHTIPTGTFSSTISKAIATCHFATWESGCNVQFKLTNTTEDTGWLTYNTVNSFTAFTSEPTSFIVKMIPKSSSPTNGYPSIYGSWVRAI